jgi:MFS family permease
MLRMAEQMPFYIFTVFVLEYGVDELGFGKNFLTNSVAAAAALSLFCVPFFGHLSDRIGRKRMYMMGAGAMLLWAFPYFALLSTAVPALVFIAVVVSLIPHDMQYGPQAAFIAEAFDTRLRYSGAGIGYQLASVFAGGPAPLIAAALLPVSVWLIAAYIAVMAAITLIATSMLPDRSREDLTQEFGEPRLGPRMQPTPTRRPVGQR